MKLEVTNEQRWIGIDEIPNLRPATAVEQAQIGMELAGAEARYLFESAEFLVHEGDLRVPGDFSPSGLLLVRGRLEIEGMYDDEVTCRGGSVAVLGDLRARDLHSAHALYVRGSLSVEGLVVLWNNDLAFEVDGQLHARGLVSDEKIAAFEVGELGFVLQDHHGCAGEPPAEERALREAGIRQLKPEYLSAPGFRDAVDEEEDALALRVDHRSLRQALCEQRPVLRDSPGPPDLVHWLRVALDFETDEAKLVSLVGRDPLVDQLMAARVELSPAVVQALAHRPDPTVQAWLQLNHPLLLNTAAERTRSRSELREVLRRAADPATDAASVLRLAQDPEPSVREKVAAREDLPDDLIRQMARDSEPMVRARLIASGLNILALQAADLDALVADSKCRASDLVKASLGTDQLMSRLQDLSEDGQLNLAYSLWRQALGVQPARMSPEMRLRALDLLLAGACGEAQSIAFCAMEASQQVERAQVIDDADVELPRLLNLCAPEFFDVCLTVTTPLDALRLEGLGANPGLSAPRQARQLAWTKAASFDAQTVLLGDLASNPFLDGEVLTELLEHCLDAGFGLDSYPWQCLLTRIDLPRPLIDRLIDVFGPAEALSVAIPRQRFATRLQLLRALMDSAESSEEWAQARAADAAEDSRWFSLLAQASSVRLREAAAFNCFTPRAVVERLLHDADSRVRIAACSQSGLPVERIADALDALGSDVLDVDLVLAEPAEVWGSLAARHANAGGRIALLNQAAWDALSARRRAQAL